MPQCMVLTCQKITLIWRNRTPTIFVCSLILPYTFQTLYDEIIPAFDVLGKKSFFLGEIGNGAKMKLVVNMIMGR